MEKVNDPKERLGATLLTPEQAAALKSDLAKVPTGWLAKVGSTNFIVSVFILVLGLWAGNSEELAKAGAQAVVGVLAFIHAARLFVITAKFDLKNWALNSNTWASALTIVGTFVAIPPKVVEGISNLGAAVEGGSLPAIASALFYLANIVLQFIRKNKT